MIYVVERMLQTLYSATVEHGNPMPDRSDADWSPTDDSDDNPMTRPISIGRRLTQLATERGDETALISAAPNGEERQMSWHQLDARSNQIARLFADYGLNETSTLVIGLPNCLEHYLATFAAWKLGAMVLPLPASMPVHERQALLDLANPALVLTEWETASFPTVNVAGLEAAGTRSDSLLPDRVPDPGRAIPSGGSTGRPKIIVKPERLELIPERLARFLGQVGVSPDQIQLVPGPLYHSVPAGFSFFGLALGQTVVLMERFDAELAVDLIERHRVEFVTMAPIMMQRIIRLPEIHRWDLTSLQAVVHSASPCPHWLKRAWIDLIGAEKVIEGYGSTELAINTTIRGDEWLEHPGSVGRATENVEIRVLDEAGQDVKPGIVGELYFKTDLTGTYDFRYVGEDQPDERTDGFRSVGDLGWLDHEGYLYLADRRTDLIITGGANIYPAEVEAILSQAPGVADVVVIGIPDEEWGRRVHAIIQPLDLDDPPTESELDALSREHLASYKVPKTYEYLPELPRNAAGKIRRSALVEERTLPKAGETAN